MIGTGRKKTIAFFIALGAGLIVVTLLLYIGGVVLDWQRGIRLLLGILLLAVIVAGVVLNTTFLVREIRRNEQHDAFINAVTHELKTPIASIRLYVETLQTRTVDENKRREFYRIILEDSDRLLSTIEQILRTGRIGSSRRPANRGPVNLTDVVTHSVERARVLHHLAPEAIQYNPDGNGEPLRILGDLEEVGAAVSNLLDNAVKYSGADAKVIVRTSREDGRFASVRVIDNGPGIPGSELKRIFKRFYRMSGPLATRVKGTGLGLFIVRSVARRHGGRAWAESQGPGRGSTFVLQFPLEPFEQFEQ
jgi:signal transduction histidine kinase